jgi:hypothetical protein
MAARLLRARSRRLSRLACESLAAWRSTASAGVFLNGHAALGLEALLMAVLERYQPEFAVAGNQAVAGPQQVGRPHGPGRAAALQAHFAPRRQHHGHRRLVGQGRCYQRSKQKQHLDGPPG